MKVAGSNPISIFLRGPIKKETSRSEFADEDYKYRKMGTPYLFVD